MRSTSRLFLIVILFGGVAVMPRIAHATAPRDTLDPTACPVTTLPAANAMPWESATYQSQYTSSQLAQQVLGCLARFFPSSATEAMVALTSLQNSPDRTFENENTWLPSSTGGFVQQTNFLRLGIPPLTLVDGPAAVDYNAPTRQPPVTHYPNEMTLASSWDPTLAATYGSQLGADAAAFHDDGVQAPDLNLARNPNWGRVMETYGEDPVLAGEIGAAETQGLLQKVPIVVLKHWGVYGQEVNRRVANNTLGLTALYDTYLRPFALTMAANPRSTVDMMCAYGNLNGDRSCTSPTLRTALSALGFQGIVRTDLGTGTPAAPLLQAGVSMIKPITLSQFQPYAAESASLQSSLVTAARNVVAQMFAAGLVSPAALAVAGTRGSLTSSLHNQDVSVANTIEERGAVLLKNASSASAGALPLSRAHGPVLFLTPKTLATTCAGVAAQLAKEKNVTAVCRTWNAATNHVTVLFSSLPTTSHGHALTRSVQWTAPTSGSYVVRTNSQGDSSLTLSGGFTQSEPGLAEHPVEVDTTIHAVAGNSYHFSIHWTSGSPSVSIANVQPSIDAAVAAARSYHSVVIFAHDGATEAMDRDTLALPFGQDALIASVGSQRPTSVALYSTGPVTMPWISNVKSIIEFWNPIGTPTLDYVTKGLSPAYAALLDGTVAPSGHLPVTFPVSSATSPMSTPNGAYWPGVGTTADLTTAPIAGEEIGYGWYQSSGWPVLFPFGFGLTYGGSVHQGFDTFSSCTDGTTASSVCLPVNLRTITTTKGVLRSTIGIYVAQPSTNPPRPTLVLGAVASTICANGTRIASACAARSHLDMHVSATAVGEWSATSQRYIFLTGCYSFVLAPNATAAYAALASTSPAAGEIVHATAPFDAHTRLLTGACGR